MAGCNPGWLRRVYPNNPLYLLSVVLVLWGIHLAAGVEPPVSGLKTGLLFAYIVMLAGAGWLVVRVGRVWEDARTLLLAILLMFTALSASYDRLCLDDPTAGGWRLAAAFGFSVVVVESLLVALRIRLPAVYRVPFYLQLVVLFAFPAYLGRLSLDGEDARMCLGVLAFTAAAGVSLLALLPAVAGRSLVRSDNGTPWAWPYYPWSIFAFMAIAMAVRSWMLSVSFSHARGFEAAFGLYFLAPIVLAVGVLLIELGLRHGSRRTQLVAAGVLVAAVGISFPGVELATAQDVSLGLLESRLAGPPLLACLAVAAIGAYAAWRRAAGAWPLTLGAAVLASSLDAETRALGEVHLPHAAMLVTLAGWLLIRGAWRLDAPRLALGAGLVLLLLSWRFDLDWLAENNGLPAASIWVAILLALPLFCRDAWSEFVREIGPVGIAAATPFVVTGFPPRWWDAPPWAATAAAFALMVYAVGYWLCERRRWRLGCVLATGGFASLSAAGLLLDGVSDPRLQRGLTVYAAGCGVLLAGLVVSLWKGGQTARLLAWFWEETPAGSTNIISASERPSG